MVAGVVWWRSVSTDPERVFWGMIDRSLATSAVSIQSTQESEGAKVRQTLQYSFGAANRSRSFTTFTQGTTTVKNEMIGTPTTDYTRYVSIQTDQKSAEGKPLDFSKVINVWAKSEGASAEGRGTQFFSQAVLGTGLPLGGVAVPIADLTPDLRQNLIRQIRDDGVYKISFDKVAKNKHKGRLAYTYEAEIQPVAYVTMMKAHAQRIGLKDLKNLNPNDYASQSPFKMRLTVDVRSHRLVQAEAVGAPIKQTYGSYGVPVGIALPAQTITVQELQRRMAELQ
jgi:hypothetical protein